MTKKIFIGLAIFVFLSEIAIAGPFGLSMGMKNSDFKGKLKEVAPYKYTTNDIPKKHSAFETYVVKIGPKSGLCYIKAIGKDISTNTYGTEVKNAFESMETKLKKPYGNNKKIDYLRYESIWSEPKDYMPALIEGERILGALWGEEHSSTLKGNLKQVALIANGSSRSKGYLSIEYGFKNSDTCDAEIAATEDGAL